MSRVIVKVWEFPSSSNPNNHYEALLHDNGYKSCNCRGWTMKREGQERSCKHTRMIDMGTADRECTASHDYTTRQAPRRVEATPPQANLAAPRKEKGPAMTTTIATRKVLWKRRTTQNKETL